MDCLCGALPEGVDFKGKNHDLLPFAATVVLLAQGGLAVFFPLPNCLDLL